MIAWKILAMPYKDVRFQPYAQLREISLYSERQYYVGVQDLR